MDKADEGEHGNVETAILMGRLDSHESKHRDDTQVFTTEFQVCSSFIARCKGKLGTLLYFASQDKRACELTLEEQEKPKTAKTPRDSAMGSSTSSSTELPAPNEHGADDVIEAAADQQATAKSTSQHVAPEATASSSSSYVPHDQEPALPQARSALSESGISSGAGSLTSYSKLKPKVAQTMSGSSEEAPLLTTPVPDSGQSDESDVTLTQPLLSPALASPASEEAEPLRRSSDPQQVPVVELPVDFLDSLSFGPASGVATFDGAQKQQKKEDVKSPIEPVRLGFDFSLNPNPAAGDASDHTVSSAVCSSDHYLSHDSAV